MKPFITIDFSIPEHHKHKSFDTQQEAEEHRDGWMADNGFVKAFVAPNPGGSVRYWIVDHVAETLIYDQSSHDGEKFSIAQSNAINTVNSLRDEKKSQSILSEGHEIDAGDLQVGEMAATLFLEKDMVHELATLTFSNGLAYATTPKKHNRTTGQSLTFFGSDQSPYNTTAPITKTGNKSFTFPITGNPATPATGNPAYSVSTFRHIPTTNETDVYLDQVTYAKVAEDLKSYVDDCQFRARDLKNDVTDAVNQAALDIVLADIDNGWPDTGV